MEQKKLYLTDLDDTLVNDGDIIDDELANKIDNVLKNKNIEFIISTARSFNSIKKKIKNLKTPIKIVSRSGAILYDETGKIIFSIEISKKELNKIINYSIKENLCPVIISIQNNYEEMFSISQYVNEEFINKTLGMDIKLINYSKINKINHIIGIYCFGKIEDCKKYSIDNIKIRTYNDFIHITNINCNKGTPIEFLKQKYSYKKITSFGNDKNDFEMLDVSDDAYLVYKEKKKKNIKYKQISFDNGEKIINIMKGSDNR